VLHLIIVLKKQIGGEGIAYEHDFEAGCTYLLSFAIARKNVETAQWILTNEIEIFPPGPNFCSDHRDVPPIPATAQILEGAVPGYEDSDWIYVEDFMFMPQNDYSRLWFRLSNIGFDEPTFGYCYLDEVKIVKVCGLSPAGCEEARENTQMQWVYQPGGSGTSIFGIVQSGCGTCEAVTENWDFGDGNTFSQDTNCPNTFGSPVPYTYQYCGTYNLCVEVVSECPEGICLIEKCTEVVINSGCESDCEGLENASDFTWYFDEGSSNYIFQSDI